MVFVPDEEPSRDPPSTREHPPEQETESFEEQVGGLVVKYLRQSSRVEVHHTGERIEVEPLQRQNERQRTETEPATPPRRETERTERNRQRASNSLSSQQTSNRDSARSIDRQGQRQRANGISNVRKLTEKQAKAYLLLEQTNGEISTADLAEEAGYASKSGAHSAKESWEEDRGLDVTE